MGRNHPCLVLPTWKSPLRIRRKHFGQEQRQLKRRLGRFCQTRLSADAPLCCQLLRIKQSIAIRTNLSEFENSLLPSVEKQGAKVHQRGLSLQFEPNAGGVKPPSAGLRSGRSVLMTLLTVSRKLIAEETQVKEIVRGNWSRNFVAVGASFSSYQKPGGKRVTYRVLCLVTRLVQLLKTKK